MVNPTHIHQRDYTIDIMKGITILLMIYAHISDTEIINRIIFSFHMPLFFVLGGYFAKEVCDWRGLWQCTRKNARRLLCHIL